jgi:GNAT superfamily N-acetyltransferase
MARGAGRTTTTSLASAGVQVEPWAVDRVADVMAVVDAALPGEGLTDDDVTAVLFDDPDPTRVVAVDGAGVAAAVVRTTSGRPVAHVQLVAVTPKECRRGVASALLADLHRWAFDEHAADAVVAGAGAPFYLWPGVDVYATAALCLFEAFGYRTERGYLDLSFSSRFRAKMPDGVEVRRVLGDDDADRTLAFVAAHWPNWVPECRRGIEHGACHAAFDVAPGAAPERASSGVTGGAVVGFGCHSVNRLGVLGPIGTDPARRKAGVGSALMSAIATDVMAAGLDEVRVSWIGPYRFYADAAGATTWRAYLNLVLPRPGRRPA